MQLKLHTAVVHQRKHPSEYGRTAGRLIREYQSYPRIYISNTGDNHVLDMLANRRNHPHEQYRKLLTQVFQLAGITEPVDVKWSKKAGCSCGCSPGFIITSHTSQLSHRDFLLKVTAE